jgi:hypothetical protein
MEYIRIIKDLCGRADNPAVGCAQITIDFFQELEEQFFSSDRNLKDEPIERDEVLAKAYEAGSILEIIDRARFPKDVELYQRVYQQLHLWSVAIENRNKALGIPIHKG